MSLDRRQFLKSSALGFVALGLPGWGRQSCGAVDARGRGPGERPRRLLLLELEGANDALATLQPLDVPRLKTLRPTLHMSSETLLHIDDKQGLNPALEALMPSWKAGRLGLIPHIGFAPADRSHFRALDIWHAGDPAAEGQRDGWLGRACAAAAAQGKIRPTLVHLADGPTPLHFAGSGSTILHLQDTESLRLPRSAHTALEKANAWDEKRDPEAAFLAQETRAAVTLARRLGDLRLPKSSGRGLGQQLAMADALARVLPEDLVFFVRHGGFDSHAAQQDSHPLLLKNLADELAGLMKSIAKDESSDFLVVVYSEFGRRIAENASRGTDHGQGGLMMLLGNRLKGGLLGPAMNPLDEVDGDLRVKVDFRTVYRALLEDHLRLEASSLGDFAGRKLDLFG